APGHIHRVSLISLCNRTLFRKATRRAGVAVGAHRTSPRPADPRAKSNAGRKREPAGNQETPGFRVVGRKKGKWDTRNGRGFDLARDIDFHTRSLAGTGERAVAGRTAGLIELGESVTWEARHLGVRQRFTARVTALARPVYFRDEMTAGAFRTFAHDHRFEGR